MKSQIYLLCLFIIIAQGKDIFTKVTSQNFDKLRDSSDHLILELYLKDCPQWYKNQIDTSEKFAHAINSAAQKVLKYVEGKNIKISFGTVNGDEDGDVIDRFTPDGKSLYPVAWMFSIHRSNDVGPMVYNSDSDENEIFDWIVARLEPKIVKLSGGEVDAWIQKAQKDLGIILFTSHKEQFNLFFDYAADHPQYSWAYTEDPDKIKEHANFETIVMFMNHDDKKLIFSHERNYDVLSKWINHNSIPSILAFDDRVMDYLFEQGMAVLLILYDPDRHEQELLEIETHALQLRAHGLKFVSIDIHHQYYFELSGFLGVRNSHKIEVAILNPSDSFKKYVLQGSPTINNLSNFIANFIQGKLTPNTVTKTPIPELPEITAANFEQYVIQNDKDVFLYIYSPTCPFSKEFNPEFDKLIEFLSINENILIYKLDGTENDPPEYVAINGYPTLLIFKNGDKQNPIIYNQDQKALSIILYLKEHVTYDWVEVPELNEYIENLQNHSKNVDPIDIKDDL